MSDLNALEQRALAEVTDMADEDALRQWHARYLGDKGELKEAMKKIAAGPKEERPAFGQAVNRAKDALTGAYDRRKAEIKERELEKSLTADALDVTLPGRPLSPGRLHVATRVLRDIYAIFADMGFQVYRSREVEDDLHNFEYLNMPPHHPARDMWDTFHTTTAGVLLRTHTSPGQIHVILPGMCYRYEAITTRSEIMFHQVEGLAIGKNISMADLKGTIGATGPNGSSVMILESSGTSVITVGSKK